MISQTMLEVSTGVASSGTICRDLAYRGRGIILPLIMAKQLQIEHLVFSKVSSVTTF